MNLAVHPMLVNHKSNDNINNININNDKDNDNEEGAVMMNGGADGSGGHIDPSANVAALLPLLVSSKEEDAPQITPSSLLSSTQTQAESFPPPPQPPPPPPMQSLTRSVSLPEANNNSNQLNISEASSIGVSGGGGGSVASTSASRRSSASLLERIHMQRQLEQQQQQQQQQQQEPEQLQGVSGWNGSSVTTTTAATPTPTQIQIPHYHPHQQQQQEQSAHASFGGGINGNMQDSSWGGGGGGGRRSNSGSSSSFFSNAWNHFRTGINTHFPVPTDELEGMEGATTRLLVDEEEEEMGMEADSYNPTTMTRRRAAGAVAGASTRQSYAGAVGEYSMTNYFLTMVRDVHNLFQSLPVWGRWVVVTLLLALALWLL